MLNYIPKWIKRLINETGFSWRYNNALIGLPYSLVSPHYRTDGFSFAYPREKVSPGFRARFFFDIYEPEERHLAKKYIKSSDNILELGGCIGVVSCITNKLLDADKTTHVVVEANPELIPWLQRNRELNQCHFLVEFCMVGDGHKQTFYLHDLIIDGSAHRPASQKTEVVQRSLPELMTKHGRFDVLIMDIEGGELGFIKSYSHLLRCFRLLVIEMHGSVLTPAQTEEIEREFADREFEKVENISGVEVWQNKSEQQAYLP